MEEQIDLMRTVWQGGMQEHHGEFYDVDRFEMSPAPPGPVPILIGGDSEVALRRAARIGDGWMGTLYGLDDLRTHLERLQGYRREYGTADRPFEIQASLSDRLPTKDVCDELEALGVTMLITSAWLMEGLSFASLDENRRALERFAATYISGS
jgi:alkanesulfonate monooxygenase SsuD/methylene tetrahydromethanopterin reductase-like flavin-dependent oxidoreductase (luciferase family)